MNELLFSDLIKESLVFVMKVCFSGNLMLLIKDVHWDAKKLIESFAFLSKFEILIIN